MSKKSVNPAMNKESELIKVFKELKEEDRVKNVVSKEPKTADKVTENRILINNRITDLFATKVEKEIELKDKYAIWLIIILIGQLILLNVWFFCKGKSWLEYSDVTFNIFVTAGIAEVFVLIRVIVQYLFSDNIAELLKLVIRTTTISQKSKNDKFNK